MPSDDHARVICKIHALAGDREGGILDRHRREIVSVEQRARNRVCTAEKPDALVGGQLTKIGVHHDLHGLHRTLPALHQCRVSLAGLRLRRGGQHRQHR